MAYRIDPRVQLGGARLLGALPAPSGLHRPRGAAARAAEAALLVPLEESAGLGGAQPGEGEGEGRRGRERRGAFWSRQHGMDEREREGKERGLDGIPNLGKWQGRSRVRPPTLQSTHRRLEEMKYALCQKSGSRGHLESREGNLSMAM